MEGIGTWTILYILTLKKYKRIREYKPMSGSSYIKTPKWISDKKAKINIKNEDRKCFEYCMLYYKHKNEIKCNPERLYH